MEKLPVIDDLWDYNKPKETEKRFVELLEKSSGLNLKYLLEIKTQLARTQSLQMNFEKSHEILDSVKDDLSPDMIVVQIRYLLERGRTYNSDNEKEKSKKLFKEAYDLSIKNGEDYYAVDCAHMMGIVEDSPEDLEWNEKAKQIAENSKDEKARKWLGSLYNNIGWSYHETENYVEALNNFRKALLYRESEKDIVKVLIAKWCVGRCLRSLGKIKEALIIQESILSERLERGMESNGYVYEELGEIYLLQKKEEESKIHFSKAYNLLSKNNWMQSNEATRLKRLLRLSKE